MPPLPGRGAWHRAPQAARPRPACRFVQPVAGPCAPPRRQRAQLLRGALPGRPVRRPHPRQCRGRRQRGATGRPCLRPRFAHRLRCRPVPAAHRRRQAAARARTRARAAGRSWRAGRADAAPGSAAVLHLVRGPGLFSAEPGAIRRRTPGLPRRSPGRAADVHGAARPGQPDRTEPDRPTGRARVVLQGTGEDHGHPPFAGEQAQSRHVVGAGGRSHSQRRHRRNGHDAVRRVAPLFRAAGNARPADARVAREAGVRRVPGLHRVPPGNPDLRLADRARGAQLRQLGNPQRTARGSAPAVALRHAGRPVRAAGPGCALRAHAGPRHRPGNAAGRQRRRAAEPVPPAGRLGRSRTAPDVSRSGRHPAGAGPGRPDHAGTGAGGLQGAAGRHARHAAHRHRAGDTRTDPRGHHHAPRQLRRTDQQDPRERGRLRAFRPRHPEPAAARRQRGPHRHPG
ncbi:hypothetical protein D9M70_391120 [compost metagenome]